MTRPKYVYAIVHKKTGTMLLEDGKVPIYWNRKAAKERAALFPRYKIWQINEDDLYLTIVTGKEI